MAKRRKGKDEEEDKPFKMPKFDEEAFLKRERRNIKANFIAFLFGVLMALICFGFWVLNSDNPGLRWILVALVGIFSISFIRYFYLKLNIDISDFTKKNWFFAYATYLFTWLLVFMIVVNPPFYDDESPLVDFAVLPDMQEFGSPIMFVAKVTDNTDLSKSNIAMTIDGETVSPEDYEFTNNIFTYSFLNSNGSNGDKRYTYSFTVIDSNGNQIERTGNFSYSNNTIILPEPPRADTPPGPEVGSATSIKFKINTNVDKIYYTIDDGEPINVTTKEGGYYITYPEFEGWIRNKEVTMKVFAVVNKTFSIVTTKPIEGMIPEEIAEFQEKMEANTFGNVITDSQTYYFSVYDETGVGIKEPPKSTAPSIAVYTVPGFEALILIAALAVVVLIFKKKKKDEKKQK